MPNAYALWAQLIGTPDRAKKLGRLVEKLRPERPGEPALCPTAALFGRRIAQKLYASDYWRPALDAWDTGLISPQDLKRVAQWIEDGYYSGPVFEPRIGPAKTVETLALAA